ncbi:branched-chain amino acid ABC transporter permease [Thermodesulfobacteriota bacterium]
MLLQQIISGTATGCIYAIVAIAFVLTYKTTDVLNFAQGEFVVVGAFIAYTLITVFKLPLVFWVLGTMAFMAVFMIVMERIFLRPLISEPPLSLLMITVGLGTIIRTVAGMVWTHESLKFPDIFSEEPIRFAGTAVSPLHIGIIIVVVIVVAILGLYFKFTNSGIAMRACGLNQLATVYMGISIKRTFTVAWVLAAMVSGIAGILLAPVIFLSTNMGMIMFKAFPAAMIGGFTSIPGAVVGGVMIGVVENLAGIYLPAGFKDAFAPALLIVILLIKPAGFFGERETKRV